MGASPLPSHQIPIPPEESLRPDKESAWSRSQEVAAKSGEHGSISWAQSRTRHLATQDGNLVAERDDLDGQLLDAAT